MYGTGVATHLSGLEEEVTNSLAESTQDGVHDTERMVGMAAAASRASQKSQPTPSIDAVKMFYDIETSSQAKDCEILQLANSSRDSLFSMYITPSSGIAPSASAVHGITCACNDKGDKCLSKGGMVLPCAPKEKAFSSFFSFVDQARGNKPSVLIGHNARVFDTPRLLNQLSQFD